MTNKFEYKSTFFIVATPIGNLEDITFRAVNVLRNVDTIACEDTRQSKKLASKFEINPKKLISYHKFSNKSKEKYLLQELKFGKNIALISDAGTPLIADPGFSLLRFLQENDVNIEVLPGACSIINALVLAGVDTRAFVFGGWFPRKKAQKIKILDKFFEVTKTVVFLESPHRIHKSIDILAENFAVPDHLTVYIVREMTKIYEEVISGTILEVKKSLDKRTLKGEMVLICSR